MSLPRCGDWLPRRKLEYGLYSPVFWMSVFSLSAAGVLLSLTSSCKVQIIIFRFHCTKNQIFWSRLSTDIDSQRCTLLGGHSCCNWDLSVHISEQVLIQNMRSKMLSWSKHDGAYDGDIAEVRGLTPMAQNWKRHSSRPSQSSTSAAGVTTFTYLIIHSVDINV